MSSIKINVYGPNAYTKTGKLKKNAPTLAQFMWIDTAPYKAGAVEAWIAEVAQKLKEDFVAFSSPYFFTHIDAKTKDGLPVRICEDVGVRDGWIITSPTRLFGNLTNDPKYTT